jgi:hypothetical protein
MGDEDKRWALLAQLVVKNGVSIGGLAEDQRPAALLLGWVALPWEPMSEAQVNVALKAAMAGAAQCLSTDHVELRRWLVDAGWLARDGYGHEYRRVPAGRLLDFNRPWAELSADRDLAPWVQEQRALLAARRAERRQAWQGSSQAA